ncbi:GTPase HflX [bacterium]|nr:GTPase HflX [bacterium]MBU1065860.1 GTPase HflX [bacterium]MBU1634183.1 GTPase HflX [bacterium]MBU1872802.1 GTPase HflX [bacterium]
MGERVLLVGVATPLQNQETVEDHLAELGELVRTLGYEVADQFIVNRKEISPSLYIGKGKVEDIKAMIPMLKLDEVIFDDDLSPTQSRNLEKILNTEIRDRSGVILEIFARHARSKEAKTQVELATLEYLLPRLTRRWTHLERQIGGIGVRGGAGETQIEVDRRLIRTRISKLKKDLQRIDRERETQRKGRDSYYRVALVGYTNAGKSTILNLLTKSDVLVEDKLFATLDTTVRQWKIDKYHNVLLSDTVGFIRKLPPNLVASFRSTLQEAREADLILKVIDISNPNCMDHLNTVNEILIQLELFTIPSLILFNKIDAMDNDLFGRVKREHSDAIYLSALKHLKIDDLRKSILEKLRMEELTLNIEVPLANTKAIALLRDNSMVIDQVFEGNTVQLKCLCYKRVWDWLRQRLESEIIVVE